MLLTLPPPTVVTDDAAQCVAPPVCGGTAFTRSTPAGTWARFPITIVAPKGGSLSADLPQALTVAARTLGATPCATIAIDVAPVAAISAGDDGMNAVVWETDAWPSAFVAGAAAQTVLTVDAQGHFRDADIHLNAHDYTFTIAGEPGSIDLRGVLTHELGHVLGLGHSDDPVATMFASTADTATWRSLEADDVLGLCTLYPGQGTPACDDARPCPADYVCFARSCERRRDSRSVCAPCEPDDPTRCLPSGNKARCAGASAFDEKAYRCGKPCVVDAECAVGAHCIATTEAGDRQCVGGCNTGPHACQTNADCTLPARCLEGSCAIVKRASLPGSERSGGIEAGSAAAPLAPGGSCNASGHGAPVAWCTLALLGACAALRRRVRVVRP